MYLSRTCSSGSRSLLPNDSPQPQRLQPPEDSIVPIDSRSIPSMINARFQLHHTQANTKKVYIRDFAQHLHNMLEDSGYKFSEEYEVRRCVCVVCARVCSLNGAHYWG